MTRWALTGCMALAALGAVAVLDVGSATAEAASSVSRFAGTYVGADPRGYYSSWTVTISDGGLIAGRHTEGSISGRIRADGSYSFTVSKTGWFSVEGHRPSWKTLTYKATGKMASDADGNIVGTDDRFGESFVWLRQ